MKNKAIFLDRDGVINHEGHIPITVKDLKIISDSIEALKNVPKEYKKIIITNQSWISRGLLTEEEVHEVHQAIKDECKKHGVCIDAVYFCPHHDVHACECRKPKPGLIFQAQKDHNIDLSESYMVGDMMRDVEAGKMAGCKKSILIERDHSHKKASTAKPDHKVKDLSEAVKILFSDKK